MLNLPIQRQFISAPLFILALSVVLFILEPFSSELLAYDRLRLASGEFWRFISGNFLHTNFNHLILNGFSLVLLWALHGQYYRTWAYLTIFMICSLGTTLGIYVFAPNMLWYVGLSGALHGLFVIGAYHDILKGYKTGWLLLVGVGLKITHEQWAGASQDVAELIGASVAIDAHLFGAFTGMLLVSYLLINKQRRR
jgi:rhomboid family GlyGly-CTERM serine protease